MESFGDFKSQLPFRYLAPSQVQHSTFRRVISWILMTALWGSTIATPILQMRKLSSGRLSNLPKVTQVVGDKAGNMNPGSLTPAPTLSTTAIFVPARWLPRLSEEGPRRLWNLPELAICFCRVWKAQGSKVWSPEPASVPSALHSPAGS